jgi:hypothetical protein
MSGSIDMRVVFIGAVALLIALQEGPTSQMPTLSLARPYLVRCAPADNDAMARFTEASGDITGSIVAVKQKPQPAATCR